MAVVPVAANNYSRDSQPEITSRTSAEWGPRCFKDGGRFLGSLQSTPGQFIAMSNVANIGSVPQKIESLAGAMVASIQTSPRASNDMPSLDESMATWTSASSRDADIASDFPRSQASSSESFFCVGENTRKSWATYQCTFYFLDCNKSFDDFQEWLSHSLSHFKCSPPPSEVQCPFCAEWRMDAGPDAWNAKMRHVAEHQRNGQRHDSVSCRPDIPLFRYLWRIRIIDNQQLKTLIEHHHCCLAKDEFVVTNSGRRERGDRRQGTTARSAIRVR